MDPILSGFLQAQFTAARTLSRESDIVSVFPVDGPLPQHYIAEFRCRGLVREGNAPPAACDFFAFGIWFPDMYLRADFKVSDIITVLSPQNLFHPNARPPYVCVGETMRAGTELTDIVYQLYEIVSYQKVTMNENKALNWDACVWARQNTHLLPLDPRPLKRRKLNLQVVPKGALA